MDPEDVYRASGFEATAASDYKGPMLTHVVLFWAKADLTAAERADFEGGLRTLLSIPKVSAGWVGTPSATDRTVVDRSYTFGLTLRFEGLAEHDAYQIDPIHDAFHARCARYWTKVAVYDVDDLPDDASPRSR